MSSSVESKVSGVVNGVVSGAESAATPASAAAVEAGSVTEGGSASISASASVPAPTSAPSASSSTSTTASKLGGYDFYRAIGSPKYVVAPMVDQSELPWRLLSKAPLSPEMAGPVEYVTTEVPGEAAPRRYARHVGGAHLTYTPMVHAKVFNSSRANSKGGDPQFNLTCGEEGSSEAVAGIEGGDRPLFVQFCANDPEVLLAAARKVEDRCDAVDINFGCPQGIARRGHYGSFLQDEWELVSELISTLHKNLKVPVTAKFRVFPEVEKTVRYAQMMEAAGAQILTCHGRTREMKGQLTGLADWDQIKAVKAAVTVPVFANGNILYAEDAERCMEYTGCDAVMSAEGNLSNPAIFMPPSHKHAYPSSLLLAERYLDICEKLETETSGSAIKAHMFRLLKPLLDENDDFRTLIGKSGNSFVDRIGAYRSALATIREYFAPPADSTTASPIDPTTGYRPLPSWVAQPYIRAKPVSSEVGGVDEFVDGDAMASSAVSRAASPGAGGGIHLIPAAGAVLSSALAPQATNAPMTLEKCVGTSCPDFAAVKCPTGACLLHCRQLRAVAAGMTPEDALRAAMSGNLVGQGCEAHEAKVAAKKRRRQDKVANRAEAKRVRKERKIEMREVRRRSVSVEKDEEGKQEAQMEEKKEAAEA